MTTAKAAKKSTRKKAPKIEANATLTAHEGPVEPVTINFDDPKVIAKIKAYNTLKDADLPIPEEIQIEIDAIVAAETKKEETRLAAQREAQDLRLAKIEQENEEGPVYIRNGYPSEQMIRLKRQGKDQDKIKLNPRGSRGDLFPLEEGDLDDPVIREGVRRGLIEIVYSGDAQYIMERQTENMQTQHVPLTTLRNEQGKPIQNVKLEAEFNRQGVVVAVENPNMGGQHENIKWTGARDGGLIRSGQEQPQVEKVSQFVPTGGNPAIISSGFASDATLAEADAKARQKGGEGPGSVLGGLTLTVEPSRKA